jgi:hypothetical protein
MKLWLGLKAGLRTVLFGVALATQGCVTPTLPPDDPPEPDVELGAGVARLIGHVGAGPSFVLVHNRASGLVFGQRTETGEYDFEVKTEPCDLLALWYTMGSFQSTSVVFRPAEVVGPRRACSGAEPPDAPADGGTEP